MLIFISQMASGLFRLMASLGRNMIVANTFGSFALVSVLVLGGFILSHGKKKLYFEKLNIQILLLVGERFSYIHGICFR